MSAPELRRRASVLDSELELLASPRPTEIKAPREPRGSRTFTTPSGNESRHPLT